MWLNRLRKLPLLGGLVDCDLGDHWEALCQTFVILVLSMAPVWLGALVIYDVGSPVGVSAFWQALYSTVAKGELFMYSTAVLAPICWIALVDPPRAKVFPNRVAHMLLVIVIDLIAAVFFGLGLAGQKLHEMFTFRLSFWMFVLSIMLLYLGTVYHISIFTDPAGEFSRQEGAFSDAVREHRQ
jgi:hypothetical protein